MSAQLPTPRRSRLSRLQRSATTAVAGCGIAAIAFTLVPSASAHETGGSGSAAHWAVKANDVPGQAQAAAGAGDSASEDVTASLQKTLRALAPESPTRHSERLASERAAEELPSQQAEAERAAAEEAAASRAAERETLARAEEAAAAEAAAAEAAAAEVTAAPEAPAEPAPAAPAAPTYTDDLDGWIREALDIMAEHGIPGSYDGLYRNIMRESSGDPNAINDWDINWINGTPSIGLLQVIQPTFDAYHVEGTPYSLYDPVANIVAAANYAWDRYGSIDNVNGPY
ncbi:transglycosylase SLT domain-containing protein [Streptomyces sp. NPDC059853]